MLDLAAREADIVNILPRAAATGGLLARDFRRSCFVSKAERVISAAKGRSVSLGVLVFHVDITNDRRHAAEECLQLIAGGGLPGAIPDATLTADDLIDLPHIAIGTELQIAEQLLDIKAHTGLRDVAIMPGYGEAFAPVIDRLLD
jgi:alkanesulfonate monooxygenase SsuD/methylene tetrahydromethanopterin reductase-like flavin-dependent oxidoreductase (luciferase family)